jgi:ribosomal protein S18 acetylase RimI-like enzyme
MPTKRPFPSHQLRPATPADAEFLWTLRQRVMKENVEQTWGKWDDAEQRKFFDRGFVPKDTNIIVVDGKDAGRIDLNHSHMEIFLGIIELMPELQRKGIGSAVIRGLMDEAKTARLPIRLQVLKSNTGAHKLYQHLGFKSVGETKTHHLMVFAPPGSSMPPWAMPRK